MRAALDVAIAAVGGGVAAPFVLGAPLALALAVQPKWPAWFGIPTQFAPHWAGDPLGSMPGAQAGARGVAPDK